MKASDIFIFVSHHLPLEQALCNPKTVKVFLLFVGGWALLNLHFFSNKS